MELAITFLLVPRILLIILIWLLNIAFKLHHNFYLIFLRYRLWCKPLYYMSQLYSLCNLATTGVVILSWRPFLNILHLLGSFIISMFIANWYNVHIFGSYLSTIISPCLSFNNSCYFVLLDYSRINITLNFCSNFVQVPVSFSGSVLINFHHPLDESSRLNTTSLYCSTSVTLSTKKIFFINFFNLAAIVESYFPENSFSMILMNLSTILALVSSTCVCVWLCCGGLDCISTTSHLY